MTMVNHPNRRKSNGERAVLVTTAHRGIFFGYATKTDGPTIKLRASRNCIYWSDTLHGFIGLAAVGPNSKCKVGPSADCELRDITGVWEVTEDAVKAWESQPWAR